MSKLSQRKSRLVVETENTVYERGRNRKIIVELRPGYAIYRLKGTRRMVVVSYTSALNLGIHNEALRKRLEKSAKRRV